MATRYGGDERRAQERWKFNKDISIADVISIVCAALAMLYSYNKLDGRLEFLEKTGAAQNALQTSTDRRQDEDALRYQARIDKNLDEINRKLDRLVERK